MRKTIAVLAVAASLVGACGGNDQGADRPVVRIYAPYRDAEAALFMAGLDEWADAAEIDVRYTGSVDFVSDLRYQVLEILSPPDIALVPQPGFVAELFRAGRVEPISDEVADVLTQHFDDESLDLGRVDGTLVGFPYRSNVKSLVWYRPGVFEELGLAPPTTIDELELLVQQVEATGVSPWCLGIEAQSATGWPATDWVEDLIVRRAGPEVYTDWVAGIVPFSDERIADSFAAFQTLVLEPGRVAGGVSTVLNTATQASGDPLFADPVGCVLFKQASFAYGWMPSGLELGPTGDIDFFLLPGEQPGPPPVVTGADLAVAFNDRPEVAAVLSRLATPEATRPWAEGGTFVSARTSVDPATFYGPVDRAMAEILVTADTVVFDGSDAMPPHVGTELFWSEITAWISGRTSYDDLAKTLDGAMSE